MKVKTEEFEKKFDAGEDVTEHLDLSMWSCACFATDTPGFRFVWPVGCRRAEGVSGSRQGLGAPVDHPRPRRRIENRLVEAWARKGEGSSLWAFRVEGFSGTQTPAEWTDINRHVPNLQAKVSVPHHHGFDVGEGEEPGADSTVDVFFPRGSRQQF